MAGEGVARLMPRVWARMQAWEVLAEPTEAVRAARVRVPDLPRRQARHRRSPRQWPTPLLLVAADHQARLLAAWRDDPAAMTGRGAILRRLVALLASGAVDGVEATPDVMEDLFYLDAMAQEAGFPSFLDGRVLIGTVNRAGWAGTVFELADRASGYTAESAQEMRLDGLKWMFRLDPDDPQTADGLLALCQGLREAERAGLPVLLEVDWVQRRHGTLVSRAEDPHCLAALVGGVSGLGPSASRRWLELPRVEALGAAMKATTLPVLGLPPERRGPGLDAVPDYEPVPGLALQGQLLGRDLLLGADWLAAGWAVAAMWRGGLDTAAAVEAAREWLRDAVPAGPAR